MIPVNLKGISANKNGNDYPYTVIHRKLYLMSHLVKLYYEDITIWDDSTNIYTIKNTKSWAKFKLRLNFIARLAWASKKCQVQLLKRSHGTKPSPCRQKTSWVTLLAEVIWERCDLTHLVNFVCWICKIWCQYLTIIWPLIMIIYGCWIEQQQIRSTGMKNFNFARK